MPPLALVLLLAPTAPREMIANGGFEDGIKGWSTGHAWYAKPAGAGLSAVDTPAGEGRDGSPALKLTGGGKRGIVMQVFPAYPGKYHASGWLKCANLAGGDARVFVEYMDHTNQWMRGDTAGSVTGTTDWQRFETELEAPEGTRSVHFDLITTEPNDGTVWFDDLAMQRLPAGLPQAGPPVLSGAVTPAGTEGCLEITWDPAKLSPGVVRLLLDEAEAPAGAPPLAVAEAADGHITVDSLTLGRTYRLRARAANADGGVSAAGPAVAAKVLDRQPPRSGWFSAERLADRQIALSWSPHVLDLDVARLDLCIPAADGSPQVVRHLDVGRLYREPRPLYCTEPWLRLELKLAADLERIGLIVQDGSGNRSDVAWAAVATALAPAAGEAPWQLWTALPTTQLPRNTVPPENRTQAIALEAARGMSAGWQILLRPSAELHRFSLRCEPLKHEDGKTVLPARWLAWHFVDYVRIEKNSVATPKEELVWPGPSDYPERLSDDAVRDVPAGRLQPLFLRVTAPRDARPGLYRGRVVVQCEEGTQSVELSLRVLPVAFPEQTTLKFVYWFSWDAPCKELGVSSTSADGWRVLRRLGELMHAYHQNVVTVPLDLIRAWQGDDGSLACDWRLFDRFIDTFAAAGVDQLFALSHIGSRTTGEWLCPTMGAGRLGVRRLGDGEAAQVSTLDVLAPLQAHLAARGLLGKCALHIADEPIPQNVESYKQLAAQAHERAPKLRRIDAIHVPDLQGTVEIMVPQLNYFGQWLEQFKAAQKAGTELWFYIAWVPQGSFPNRMIDSQAIKNRTLHWLNYLYGTTGYLHWALNHWGIALDSLGSPGDSYIAWPSKRYIANSSLRYEAELDGLDDCELMFMLQRRLEKQGLAPDAAQAKVAALGRPVVTDFTHYRRDWSDYNAVRHELLNALAAGK